MFAYDCVDAQVEEGCLSEAESRDRAGGEGTCGWLGVKERAFGDV